MGFAVLVGAGKDLCKVAHLRISLLVLALLSFAVPALALRSGPDNVLVIFNDAWTGDSNGDGVQDSLEVAQYYAARRGIPALNLWAVSVSTTSLSSTMDYDAFYDNFVVPLWNRMQSTYGGSSNTYAEQIHYLALCYGVPARVRTNFAKDEHPISRGYSNSVRTISGFLNKLRYVHDGGYATHTDGTLHSSGPVVHPANPSGEGNGSWWGDRQSELNAPWYGQHAQHFIDWRNSNAKYDGYFLVSRVGAYTVEISKGFVDKALYAEKYLRRHDTDPTHPYYGVALADWETGSLAYWLGRSGIALRDLVAGQGVSGHSAVFGTWRFWYDNHSNEIGQSGHLPRIVSSTSGENRIAQITGNTVTIDNASHPLVGYIKQWLGYEGRTVQSSGGGSAVISSIDTSANTITKLTLDNVASFNSGDTVSWDYLLEPTREGDTFPFRTIWFTGHYQYGAVRHMHQWVPGGVGFHLESGSGQWWRNAGDWGSVQAKAGITAYSGPVGEPFSSGVIQGLHFWPAFFDGWDFAEAAGMGTQLDCAWMTNHVGDPLYSPFKDWAGHVDDAMPPVFATVSDENTSSTSRTLIASLAAASDEEFREIAQFKIEWGTTAAYGDVYDFSAWPNPTSTAYDAARRWFFSRRLRHTISGLTDGQTYHYRVTARDPYGNETATSDLTFVAGQASSSNQPPVAAVAASWTSVTVGQDPALDGSGSSDPEGALTLYEWDLDYDGATFTVDASGASLTTPPAIWTTPGIYEVALRVTDAGGLTAIDVIQITVTGSVDTTPPDLSFTDLTVSGTVADPSILTVDINGTAFNLVSGAFAYDVPLSALPKTITVVAIDAAALIATRTITFSSP